MMKWKAEQDQRMRHKMDSTPNINISITDSPEGRQWQFFDLYFGVHSDSNVDSCKRNWPREALTEARKRLDEFEEFLSSQESTAE